MFKISVFNRKKYFLKNLYNFFVFIMIEKCSSVSAWVGFTAMLDFLVKFPVYAAIYLAAPKAHLEVPV